MANFKQPNMEKRKLAYFYTVLWSDGFVFQTHWYRKDGLQCKLFHPIYRYEVKMEKVGSRSYWICID